MKKTISIFGTLLCFILLIAGCGVNDKGMASEVDFGENDYKKINVANNELGFLLMKDLKEDDQGNRFFSPTSLYIALSMVYNGADGETKKEMAEALQVKGIDVEELNKANASLIHTLHLTKQVQLDIANSIWLNQDYHFQDEFAKNTRDYFNAKIEEVDMADQKTADLINKWVKKETNDKIDGIIDSVNPEIVSILLNAIYFKGNWTYEFDPKQTEKRLFTGVQKNVEIPLMMAKEEFPYLETEHFQAVSLPYGEAKEMSMTIWLPKEDFSLEELESLLTAEQWSEWRGEFHSEEGTVLLPKFQLEYETTLNENLEKLGMMTAFDRNKADFTNMIQEKEQILISKVKQKTFIDVNEKGTEAAAVTSVEMKVTSAPVDPPFYMEINRPFYFTINHESTDTILFMGAIKQLEE